jgi:hypothetical protein
VATRRKTLEELEAMTTGGEPKFSAEVVSEKQMMLALNWYGQNRDSKQAAKYINDYLKKQKLKVAADVVLKQPGTFGFLCRMKNTGALFSEKHEEKFKSYLDAMLVTKSKPAVEKEEKKPIISIQDRVAEKVSEMIGELEGTIDDFMLGGYKTMPNPYGIMHGMNVKAMHAKAIQEWAKERRSEFDDVLTTEDKQTIEGYSNFKKTDIKKLVAYCDQVIKDCIKISGESVASRKPRKRKVKSPDELVKNVKYQDEFTELQLKSIAAKEIIGAISLWVYNVKTKKLSLYNAEDASGFSVKGSTLTGFSTTKSETKTLRKPEKTLPEVLKGGKVALRSIMDGLTTKAAEATGRLNVDTIILRAIK